MTVEAWASTTHLVEFLDGAAASFLTACVVSVITVASIFVQDPESTVVSRIPTRLANFLRDRWQTWAIYNKYTWIRLVPFLAATRRDLLGKLLQSHNEHLNVPYKPNSRMDGECALDIFHHGLDVGGSVHTSSTKRPVVVFVHGGAWSYGSKELHRLAGKQFRDAGLVSAVVGYRRYPVASSAWESAQDVGAALSFVSDNIAAYGGDPGRIVLVGHSSGAHISSLHLLSGCGAESPRPLLGFIGVCGVYDIKLIYEAEKARGIHELSALPAANGRVPEAFARSCPLSLARALSESGEGAICLPRFVTLIHCANDDLVPVTVSQQFVNALRNLSAAAAKGKGTHTQDTTIAPIMTQASAAKDRVKLHVEQRGGHSGPIWSLMFAEGQSLGEISQKPPVLLALVRQLFQDKT